VAGEAALRPSLDGQEPLFPADLPYYGTRTIVLYSRTTLVREIVTRCGWAPSANCIAKKPPCFLNSLMMPQNLSHTVAQLHNISETLNYWGQGLSAASRSRLDATAFRPPTRADQNSLSRNISLRNPGARPLLSPGVR
jgi:hypothetical protein